MTCVADPAGADSVDHALVARVLLADDRRAFAQLVRRHQGMVRAQLRRLVNGDAVRADDLAQETFVQAWRKLHQFRGEARFSTWLYRIAYSRFLQARRKRLATTPDQAELACERGPELRDQLELRLDVQRALRRLSEPEQLVLLHVVQLGLSHEEVAYVLSMPLGTVKSHTNRGKAKLREHLADWKNWSQKDGGS